MWNRQVRGPLTPPPPPQAATHQLFVDHEWQDSAFRERCIYICCGVKPQYVVIITLGLMTFGAWHDRDNSAKAGAGHFGDFLKRESLKWGGGGSDSTLCISTVVAAQRDFRNEKLWWTHGSLYRHTTYFYNQNNWVESINSKDSTHSFPAADPAWRNQIWTDDVFVSHFVSDYTDSVREHLNPIASMQGP